MKLKTNKTNKVRRPRKTRKTKKTRRSKHKYLGGDNEDSKIINICSDSEYCLSFGLESDEISEYFNHFTDFETNIETTEIKKIDDGKSANGFIILIPYKKEEHKVYSILKSSLDDKADNLIYEGIVGSYLNTLYNQFPCFVKTYAVGNYKKEPLYRAFKSKSFRPSPILNELLVKGLNLKYIDLNQSNLSLEIANSCLVPHYNCVLTEFIQNTLSFDKIIQNDGPNLDLDLIGYLFQVFCPLNKIQDQFTHYDLHNENALVYFPAINKDKYVTLNYHVDGETITFNTLGIVKIIDYGHSFFYMNESVNSEKIREIICESEDCNPDPDFGLPNCGANHGYSYMKQYSRIHIVSNKKNVSHDLRLLSEVKYSVNEYSKSINPEITNLLYKLHYSAGLGPKDKKKDHYGTPEKEIGGYPNSILNVSDAYKFLKDLIIKTNADNDQQFANMAPMGVLDIWIDEKKPMKYISIEP
jgi:hypothetical protein